MRILRFAMVGGSAALLQMLLLIAFVEWLYVSPVPASASGYAISAIYNYAMNRRLTFKSGVRHRRAVPRFAMMVLSGLAINTALMAVLVPNQRVPYPVWQIFSTLCVFLWNYWVSLRWVFACPVRRSCP
jgi:putative flippase GtrA